MNQFWLKHYEQFILCYLLNNTTLITIFHFLNFDFEVLINLLSLIILNFSNLIYY